MNLNKYQEILDKRRFFNQRAGRELWNDKPPIIQQIDIDNAERDYDSLQELIDKYKKLEKSLDKACELLEINSMKRTDAHVYMSKEKWKEWILNDK